MQLIPISFILSLSLASLAIVDYPLPTSQPTDEALLASLESTLQSVIDRTAPGVVAIRANRSPLSTSDISKQTAPPVVTGSGVIIRHDGMILTCHHVIEGAATIEVTLHDGRRLRAKLVAQDPRDDLAILRVSLENLQAVTLADVQRPVRGSIVVALGYPFGATLDGHASASFGIVSAVGRAIPEEFCRDEDRYFGDMIQATATIQSGCSGGGLVDRKGTLIGILSVRAGDAGSIAATGFAIPINTHTRSLIERMLLGESVEYAYLGVDVATLIEPSIIADKASTPSGVRVVRVWDDGPARLVGLRPGDIIKSIDNEPLASPDEFVRLMGQFTPGRQVKLQLVRRDGPQSLDVRLVARHVARQEQVPTSELELRGATLSKIDGGLPQTIGMDGQAMMVVRVEADSAADRAGITPGDIIVGLEGRPIRISPDDWPTDPRKDLLIGLSSGASVLVKAEEE
jgi:S1-C subfamily serine protease